MQVPGCQVEIPDKGYYKRYRICQMHAKMQQMTLDGRPCRFCQHCGKFQALYFFDGAFKSCTKSLERHRASQSHRIRKKGFGRSPTVTEEDQPSSADARSGGNQLQQTLNTSGTTTAGGGSTVPSNTSSGTRSSTPSVTLEGSPGNAEFVGLRGGGGGVAGDVEMLCFVDNKSSGESAAGGGGGGAETGIPPLAAPLPIPSIDDLDINDLPIPFLGDEDLTAAELMEMFGDPHDDGDDGDDDGVNALYSLADFDSMSLQFDITSLAQLPPPPMLPPVPSLPSQRPQMMQMMPYDDRATLGNIQASTAAAAPVVSISAPSSSSVVDATVNMATTHFPTYTTTTNNNLLTLNHDIPVVVRASIKLFNTAPENLPPTVREALHAVLNSSMVVENSRPGCAYITADAVMMTSQARALQELGARWLLEAALAQGSAFIPQELLTSSTNMSTSASGTPSAVQGSTIVAQLHDNVAALRQNGNTVVSGSIDGTDVSVPQVCAIIPVAMMLQAPQPLTLLGTCLSGDQDVVVCRRGKDTPDLGVLKSGPSTGLQQQQNKQNQEEEEEEETYTSRGLAAGEYVHFSLIEVKEGLHSVEIQKGSLLSPSSVSFLVLDDEAAVVELRQLEINSSGVESVSAFVQSVGIVLEHLRVKKNHPNDSNASPAAAIEVALLAARIATTAVVRRWPALLRLISPAVSVSAMNTTMLQLTTPDMKGVTLLHLAACSGCVDVVAALVDWAATSVDYEWGCEGAGPLGITPLHIAAVLDDGAAMSAALTNVLEKGGEGRTAWFSCAWMELDRASPAKVAQLVGNTAVIDFLAGLQLSSEGDVGEHSLPIKMGVDDASGWLSSGDGSQEQYSRNARAAAAAAGGGGAAAGAETAVKGLDDGGESP